MSDNVAKHSGDGRLRVTLPKVGLADAKIIISSICLGLLDEAKNAGIDAHLAREEEVFTPHEKFPGVHLCTHPIDKITKNAIVFDEFDLQTFRDIVKRYNVENVCVPDSTPLSIGDHIKILKPFFAQAILNLLESKDVDHFCEMFLVFALTKVNTENDKKSGAGIHAVTHIVLHEGCYAGTLSKETSKFYETYAFAYTFSTSDRRSTVKHCISRE